MNSITINSATDLYQRHEKKLILVVVVLLSLYLIAFVAKLTWYVIPSPEQNTNQQNTNANAPQANRTNDNNVNISQILNLNLFGDAQAQPTAEVVQSVSEAPETKLNLVLSGVVASNQADRGAAIIEYRNSQSTYGVGDKIEGTNVTLDEIYTDRVIIKNRLTRETLMLEGVDYDEANAKRNRDMNRQLASEPTNTQARVGPTNRPNPEALREARRKLASSPDSFTEMISMSPHRVNGQLMGYRVTPGTNPALFNSVGLQSGDVITILNGLDLTDLQQSLEALAELQEAESLELEILRGSEFISLDLEIPDDSDF
jgi:general secretion pathway protein C